MRVEKINTENGERYILLDHDGNLVIPVAKFLKFKDNIGTARNSLRRFCYSLKIFYDFLSQRKISIEEVTIDLMGDFVRFLKLPCNLSHLNVSILSNQIENLKYRDPKTINYILDDVIKFYDYLDKHDDSTNKINEKVKKKIVYNSDFKSFLHHISSKIDKHKSTNFLKQKVQKKKIKTLTQFEVEVLINHCTNLRDKFLLFLLYETGMRIGEALSLYLSDINVGMRKISIIDRGHLENNAEIKTVGSERVIDCSQELINFYSRYLLEIHDQEGVDTNFVFIKLNGINQYKPMDYQTVVGIFNNLKKKTKINATPHMFRHTSITELAKNGMKPEILKQRAGHKQIQTTLGIYSHFTEDDVRNEWIKIRQIQNGGIDVE